MKNLKSILLWSFLLTICTVSLQAQDGPEHRMSPVVIEHQIVDDTYMKVVYGQPFKRGRVIFGELEPFGEVWRAGANESTEITITNDILFGDQHLSAGTYSLFAIPEETSWTIIVNAKLGQWGAYSYEEEKDVLRIEVPVQQLEEVSEAFTIGFSDDGSSLDLMWDQTAVSVPVKTLP
ncbi:MAG: DUF2911 domain-containing protein [Balneolales bacterium]